MQHPWVTSRRLNRAWNMGNERPVVRGAWELMWLASLSQNGKRGRQSSVGGKRVTMMVATASREIKEGLMTATPVCPQICEPVTATLRTSRSPTLECHTNREHELVQLHHSSSRFFCHCCVSGRHFLPKSSPKMLFRACGSGKVQTASPMTRSRCPSAELNLVFGRTPRNKASSTAGKEEET